MKHSITYHREKEVGGEEGRRGNVLLPIKHVRGIFFHPLYKSGIQINVDPNYTLTSPAWSELLVFFLMHVCGYVYACVYVHMYHTGEMCVPGVCEAKRGHQIPGD